MKVTSPSIEDAPIGKKPTIGLPDQSGCRGDQLGRNPGLIPRMFAACNQQY